MSNEINLFSEKVLVTNILNGNVQGFAVVVKSTEKLVTQIVRKMITNEDDQKDLVQDIYLKAYQNLASFQFKSKLSTWIANIAYNTTINYLQKKKIPVIGIETSTENKFIVVENPELETIKTETITRIRQTASIIQNFNHNVSFRGIIKQGNCSHYQLAGRHN